MPAAFTKVLIANRGEVVARIARSCHDLGLSSVAIFSDADAGAPFVSTCDQAVRIGGSESADSYLDIAKVIAAAKRSGADAIHPGYGFLAENATFARACVEAQLVFIGPHADVIERLGSKQEAKAMARAASVPVIDGYDGADQSDTTLASEARALGFPVLIKASAGGGGKGMRVVRGDAELEAAISAAKREAESAFGDATVLIERYIERPRHIEIQILADCYGNIVHLGERECSVQRRHQKIIEECPSPAVNADLRARMGEAAVSLARSAGYVGAGTVEFIVDARLNFYFLEVNTRLQVEHPVTEMVTGIDIVREQLQIAAKRTLEVPQPAVMTGHAIECRLYAEDPDNDFLPQSGSLAAWQVPDIASLRVEAALTAATEIPPHYDPMLAKLCCHGATRGEALDRMRRTLALLWAPGVTTNQAFLRRVLEDDDFRAGALHTHYIDDHEQALLGARPRTAALGRAAMAAALFERAQRAAARTILPALPAGYSNNSLGPEVVTFNHGNDEIAVSYATMRDGSINMTAADVEEKVAAHGIVEDGITLESADGLCRSYRVARRGDELFIASPEAHLTLTMRPRFPDAAGDEIPGALVAPMPSKVIHLLVEAGQQVAQGDAIAILEAMKMEHQVGANQAGTIARVAVTVGQQLEAGQLLVVIEANED